MGKPYIKTEALSFSYDGEDNREIPVLHDINIEIDEGSFVAILGHNGSGKSTLAKLLNLILTPSSGKIWIDGKDITSPDISDSEIFDIRRNVGMVFQNPDNQLVATVVEEDIAFGPENLGVAPSEIRRRVDEALDVVGMKDYSKRSPHQLSGGQKQRIAIAGILAMLPKCIIFDESTAMLDPKGRSDVMNIIEDLNRKKGITVLHITHNMEEAVRADRIIVINDGRVFLDGTPKEIFTEVSSLHSVGLDVPQVTELFYELSCNGIAELEKGVIEDTEAEKILVELLK
ncbi:MAG: energy-coupling factor transporter ATPase [Ruminococcaceae bacterium]|nr:energy-coupling factor transporter ATPase [Oscillospiraceae bacterium]